jgi:pimeloyl-ACP methyl ester carboxylesterase
MDATGTDPEHPHPVRRGLRTREVEREVAASGRQEHRTHTGLSSDSGALGLRRLTVPTSVGAVVARVGREAGGPATILLHGAAGSWTTWTPLLRRSDETGASLTDVIAVDLPGWGESPSGEHIREVSDLSDAVVEVARSLGYERWELIGHSLGGLVALDIAAREPAATISVGLVSSSGVGVLDAIRRPLRGGLRLPGFAGMLLAMRLLAAMGRAGTGLLGLLHRTGLLTPLSAPLFAHPDRVDRSVTEALAAEIRPSTFALAAAVARRYDDERWREVRCPVRAVRGEADVFVGRRDGAVFAERIADYEELRLPDAGHFAAVEDAAGTLAFLRN